MTAGRRFTHARQRAGLGRLVALCLGLCLGLGGGLGLPALASKNTRAASALHMRQLSKPFSVPPRLAWRHGLRPARSRGAAARPFRYRGHARRTTLPAIAQLSPALRSARERWPDAEGRTARSRAFPRSRLMRRPAVSADIRAEQLLIFPRADGYGDDRLDGVARLGIPVIRDVPPIIVLNPPRPERIPFEGLVRRRAR